MEIGHPVDRTDDDLAEHDDHEEVEHLEGREQPDTHIVGAVEVVVQGPVYP